MYTPFSYINIAEIKYIYIYAYSNPYRIYETLNIDTHRVNDNMYIWAQQGRVRSILFIRCHFLYLERLLKVLNFFAVKFHRGAIIYIANVKG